MSHAPNSETASATGRRANRLAQETSPYLLQHAYNPVDWYPWGEAALKLAKERQVPIFLSIGYSACHWCHVMEHESFESETVAEKMNRYFVNIKVDREERPDLDAIYMTAVQLLTGHGGWPMSVWMTPEMKPFFAGTYYPPQPRFQMPSFTQVIDRIHEVWQTRRNEVYQQADELTKGIQQAQDLQRQRGALADATQEESEAPASEPVTDSNEEKPIPTIGAGLVDLAATQASNDWDWLRKTAQSAVRYFDPVYGGVGQQPKFPHPILERVLLFAAQQLNEPKYLDEINLTLEKMLYGGIFDQLGGGFHRYSTDQKWLVPHFEKMLYDNAGIPMAYLEAFQATGNPEYRRAVEETLDYILRDMTGPDGLFYSAQDADSEGVEGKYYVWSKAEIVQILGPDLSELFCRCYDVSTDGNWEGTNILNLSRPLTQQARDLDMELADLQRTLRDARQQLVGVRSHRIAPGLDNKVITAWNGMMIDTLASAGNVLDRADYRQAAARAATSAWQILRTPENRLYRTAKLGQAKLQGYLEDYTYLANACLSVYEATFQPIWIERAAELLTIVDEFFLDEQVGDYFFTAKDHEELLLRLKEPNDNPTPSGQSMAVLAQVRLGKLTGTSRYQDRLQRIFEIYLPAACEQPLSMPMLLFAYAMERSTAPQYVLVPATAELATVPFRQSDGTPTQLPTREDLTPALNSILTKIHRLYQPGKQVLVPTTTTLLESAENHPLPGLIGKTSIAAGPTVYLCRNFTCQAPWQGLQAIEQGLMAQP